MQAAAENSANSRSKADEMEEDPGRQSPPQAGTDIQPISHVMQMQLDLHRDKKLTMALLSEVYSDQLNISFANRELKEQLNSPLPLPDLDLNLTPTLTEGAVQQADLGTQAQKRPRRGLKCKPG